MFKMSPSAALSQPRAKRGFNLIEMAMVMGVVGMVLGGVWVGASAIRDSFRINETVKGVMLTVKNVQNLITSAHSTALGFGAQMTPQLIAAGVFYPEWVQNNMVRLPYGGQMNISNYTGVNRFDVYLNSIPQNACIQILQRLTQQSMLDNGLHYIAVYDTTSGGTLYYNTSTFPVSLSTANTACGSKLTNFMVITFKYIN